MRPSRWQVVTLVVALCFLSGVVGWWIAPSERPHVQRRRRGLPLRHAGPSRWRDLPRVRVPRPRARHADRSDGARDRARAVAGDLGDERVPRAGGPSTETTDDVAMDWMGLAVPITRMPGMPTDAEMAELRAAAGRRSRRSVHPPHDQPPRRGRGDGRRRGGTRRERQRPAPRHRDGEGPALGDRRAQPPARRSGSRRSTPRRSRISTPNTPS